MARRSARIAVVQVRWTFWEHSMPEGHLARRIDDVDAFVERVGRASTATADTAGLEFESLGLWDVDADEPAGLSRLDEVDALLLVVTMAAPPRAIMKGLERWPQLPLVVCGVDDDFRVGDSFGHADIAARGATVGLPMLTSALTRAGRRFDLALASLAADAELTGVVEACRAAGAAGRLQRARIGRIGRHQVGYLHVDAPDELLRESFGVSMVSLEPDEFAAAYRSASGAEVEREAAEHAPLVSEQPADEDGLERTARADVALRSLIANRRLDAGAMNCHVAQIRLGDEIGIAPCFALGQATTAGSPWTCTGDVLTATAMLLSQLVSQTSLYHELEAMDVPSQQLVVANTGEHDGGLCDHDATPRLRPNVWFEDVDDHRGYCLQFALPAMPATLVGVCGTPDGRLRIVCAEGETTGDSFDEVGTANGGFRFASGDVRESWLRWVRAGVTHHSALARGHLGESLTRMALHLGLECVVVDEARREAEAR